MLANLRSLLPLGEKWKIINELQTQVMHESEVNEFLKNCGKLSPLEYDLLKNQLANKFHRSDLIVELLQTGERTIMRRAIKNPWIYEINRNLLSDSDFLLNHLFQNVSWSFRQTLVHKIGYFIQSEEHADHIWNAVSQKYGICAAVPLLQACTREKLKEVVSLGYVRLRDRQMKTILQKYPDIGLVYLKNHLKRLKDPLTVSNARSFRRKRRFPPPTPIIPFASLNYLVNNCPDEFLDLFIEYSDKIENFSLGRRRSIQLIRTCRGKVLQHSDKLRKFFNFEKMQKEFSFEELELILLSSLPDKEGNIGDVIEIWNLFRIIPLEQRLNVCSKVFYKKYQINLCEHPEYMSPEFIQLLSDEKRLSVVQWKIINEPAGWLFKEISMYHYGENHLFCWTVLKPINHSLPELQKFLFAEQNMYARCTLSKCLIITCFINQDLPQLYNVLILLNNRSRNDQQEVRDEIFRIISSIMDDMEFAKEHWEIIMEMIEVDKAFAGNGTYNKIIDKCLAYYIKFNLHLHDVAILSTKSKMKSFSSTWVNPYLDDYTDTKKLLEMYVHQLAVLYPDGISDDYSFDRITTLINDICKFNHRIRKLNGYEPILIGLQPWWKKCLEDISKTEENYLCVLGNEQYTTKWNNAIQNLKNLQKLKNDQKLSLDTLISSEELSSLILQSTPNESACNYLLFYNPTDLQRHWKDVFSKVLVTKCGWIPRFMAKMKRLNYEALVTETIEICIDKFNRMKEGNSEVSRCEKRNVMFTLSVLYESTDFLTLVAPFQPVATTIDVYSRNSDEAYATTQAVVKSFMYVSVPHLALTIIEKFCVGDYLKLAVGSLYSLAIRVAETKCLEFLRPQLLNTRVSLQKHIIRLYFKISSADDIIRVLKEIGSSNLSIRLEIFLQTWNLIKLNPSMDVLYILKTTMEKISLEDTPIIKHLENNPNFDVCPIEFLSDYVQLCIQTLTRVKAESLKNFFDHLTKIIDKIAEDVLLQIVKNMNQESFNSNFCINFLVHSSSALIQSQRFSKVWSIVQCMIQNNWDQINSKATRKLVYSFITDLCKVHMNDTSKIEIKKQILQAVLSELKGELITKVFKEVLYVELCLLLADETGKEDCERFRGFGRSVGQFIDSLVEKYGGEVTHMIYDTVYRVIEHCLMDELMKTNGILVELVDGIRETSASRHNQMISITLLNEQKPKADHLIATFEKVRTYLNQSDDIVSQFYQEYVSR